MSRASADNYGDGRAVDGNDYLPLFEQVRAIIRERIIDGTYAPGDRLVEREISAELGVSRVPVREAFRGLESEGFVTVLPRRGVTVRQLSRVDLEELFDLRFALEVHACRRAAVHATPEGLRALERSLKKAQAALSKGDLPAFAIGSEEFHDQILLLAQNRTLASLLEPLLGRLHWIMRQIDEPDTAARQHAELYRAIASGDPDRAAACALEHIESSRKATLRLLLGDQNGA